MSDSDNIPSGGYTNNYPGTISSSLLGGIKDSQEDAWRRVSLLYAPLIYLWCRQNGIHSSDCDDIVQEVLRVVVSRVGEFERTRAKGSFRGWLRAITRNKIGDFIRVNRRRQQLFDEMASLKRPSPLAATEAANDAVREETRLVFNQVLELIRTTFEEATWRAFLRVVMDGASPRAVAQELDLSVESVYQAKSRVLRRIRDELRELGS